MSTVIENNKKEAIKIKIKNYPHCSVLTQKFQQIGFASQRPLVKLYKLFPQLDIREKTHTVNT